MQFEVKLSYEFPFKGEIFELEEEFFKVKSNGEKLIIEITPVLSAKTVEEFKKTMVFMEEIGKVWLDKVLTQIFEHKQLPAPTREEEIVKSEEIQLEESIFPAEEPIESSEPEPVKPAKEPPVMEPAEPTPTEESTKSAPAEEPPVVGPTEPVKEQEKQPSSDFEGIESELLSFFENPSTEETFQGQENIKEAKQKSMLEEKQEITLQENGKEIKEETKEGEKSEQDFLKEVVGLKEEEGGEKKQPPFREEESFFKGFINDDDRKILEEAFYDYYNKKG